MPGILVLLDLLPPLLRAIHLEQYSFAVRATRHRMTVHLFLADVLDAVPPAAACAVNDAGVSFERSDLHGFTSSLRRWSSDIVPWQHFGQPSRKQRAASTTRERPQLGHQTFPFKSDGWLSVIV
jgi:hypothetical protein